MQAIAVSTTHLLINFFIITTSRDFQEIPSDIKVVFNFYTWTTGWFFFHIPCATNWGRPWDFVLYICSKFVSRRCLSLFFGSNSAHFEMMGYRLQLLKSLQLKPQVRDPSSRFSYHDLSSLFQS
ncbi:hypothetical protein C4D60_Mb08t07350 [Musa balbisiana]|uniref:Uncharacterized protein n=1 Tax=Musa balbisiana TaxID=52838 RepID=A0A4S8K208_MUSBA|nr:hypothetical protein C4D60_Mb08t07350 [Musa balbisiana]